MSEPDEIRISGELATGVGEATGFTQLDWARAAFREKLGIDPYPGTVNMIVRADDAIAAWERVKASRGVVIPPPRADWCDARCFPAAIESPDGGRIRAAIVLPDVGSYPARQIELIAEVGVRTTLGIVDGDRLTILVEAD